MPITRNYGFNDETHSIISNMPKGFSSWGSMAVLGILSILIGLSCILHYPQTVKTIATINPPKVQNLICAKTDTASLEKDENTEGEECQILIPDTYINQVKVGQTTFVNWNSQSIPLRGKITAINPVPTEKVYSASVSLESKTVGLQARAGAEIVIQDVRLIEYLFQPLRLFLEKQRQSRREDADQETPKMVQYSGNQLENPYKRVEQLFFIIKFSKHDN
jgi:hypothetical protein